MEKLLITTNDFWLGGRETFLSTYLDLLRGSASALLVASDVMSGAPGLELFDEIFETGSVGASGRLGSWLDLQDSLRTRPVDLVWGQHYDLLPAWLLSRRLNVPMMATFHGPLFGAGRPNSPYQALGMTLAIHRAEAVTGVSSEVVADIRRRRGGDAAVSLIPNTVKLEESQPISSAFPPRTFLLVTRRDKLEHIRQSVRLFATYASRVRGSRLIVVDGEMSGTPGRISQPLPLRATTTLRQLGRKWCVRQGWALAKVISRIEFVGWTADARHLMRKSDVVLGMGRVLLEAVAENRPAVLVGYRDVHGLLTEETFDRFRASNFSGRGIPAAGIDEVARSLETMQVIPDLGPRRREIADETWLPELLRIIERCRSTSVPAADSEIADLVSDWVGSGLSQETIIGRWSERLSDGEMTTYRALLNG